MVRQRCIVSIGLCVKNAAQTIGDAINSIITQDFPHEEMEILVVDGYSTDGTMSVIKGNRSDIDIDQRVFRDTGGLGKARQIVVDNSRGKYVVWVDGDMVLTRDFVRKQVEFMDKHPEVGIGKGKYDICEGESIVATLENFEFVLDSAQETSTVTKVVGASGCIYRLKAIKEVGGFDERMSGVGEDMEIEHRIRDEGWAVCITPARFLENRRGTLKDLWEEYFWHGGGGYRLFRKDSTMIEYWKMFPPAAIAKELKRMSKAYRLLHRPLVFLLPLHYVFKRAAWVLGFVHAWRTEEV